MSPADRDALVEQVAGAHRVRAGDDLTYHKAWHDLGPADRARAHALASALRPNEAALDPDAILAEWTAAGFTETRIDYTDVIGGPLPWMLPVSSSLLWNAVFAIDRAWLAVPPLRRLASQFAIAGRRSR